MKTINKIACGNGFSNSIIKKIIKITLAYKSVEKIVLFGSRAATNYKDVSDIDIAIFAKDWTDTDINLAKNLLDEEIKIPLKFDVVSFYDLRKESLKKNILEKGKVIYESGKG